MQTLLQVLLLVLTPLALSVQFNNSLTIPNNTCFSVLDSFPIRFSNTQLALVLNTTEPIENFQLTLYDYDITPSNFIWLASEQVTKNSSTFAYNDSFNILNMCNLGANVSVIYSLSYSSIYATPSYSRYTYEYAMIGPMAFFSLFFGYALLNILTLIVLHCVRDQNNVTVGEVYTLLVFGGLLGLHRLYLNKKVSGVIYLFTIGCFGVGWIVDFFLIPRYVNEYKKNIEYELHKGE